MAIPQATAKETSPKGHRGKRQKRVWKDKHWRWVPDGNGDWKVQGYIFRHKHKPAKNHPRGPGKKPARRAASSIPAAVPVDPDPRPAGAYQGTFGTAQAIRLLNRAGFGPVAGQAEQLVSLGLVGAVQSLTRPSGAATLNGAAPVTPTAARSRQPTTRATTTSGGSTAWSAATSSWSSGWRSSSTTGSPPARRRLQPAADARPVGPLPRRLLRLVPRPVSR